MNGVQNVRKQPQDKLIIASVMQLGSRMIKFLLKLFILPGRLHETSWNIIELLLPQLIFNACNVVTL